MARPTRRLGQPCPGERPVAPVAKETLMLDVIDKLRSRQLVAIAFAFLSGLSAIGTAVLPAVLIA